MNGQQSRCGGNFALSRYGLVERQREEVNPLADLARHGLVRVAHPTTPAKNEAELAVVCT